MQIFLIFFYILDQSYDQCKEDDLGEFLGAISPEIWDDGQPSDKSIFDDWQENNLSAKVDAGNIIEKIYDFISYYEREFDLDFSKTKQWILAMTDKTIIKKAYEKAQVMNEKFHYDTGYFKVKRRHGLI